LCLSSRMNTDLSKFLVKVWIPIMKYWEWKICKKLQKFWRILKNFEEFSRIFNNWQRYFQVSVKNSIFYAMYDYSYCQMFYSSAISVSSIELKKVFVLICNFGNTAFISSNLIFQNNIFSVNQSMINAIL
jgi:hypothetical protein